MSHTPHERSEEFPGQTDILHRLKASDAHFARIADEYHAVNHDIHRAETGVAPVDEMVKTDMCKKRAALKDEISRMLRAADQSIS